MDRKVHKSTDENTVSNVQSVRLLFITSSLATGGSEKKTVMIANKLSGMGRDVHLVYLGDPDDLRNMISDDVKVVRLGRRSRIDLAAISKLRSYIVKNNISILWNVNLFAMLYGFLATSYLRQDIRMILSVNTTHFRSIYSKVQMFMYLPIIRRMDCIVFGCENQMSLWLSSYRLPNEKSTVIYNGVDTEYYSEDVLGLTRKDVRAKYGLDDTDIVIGMVARLMREKGHIYALEAIQQLHNEGIAVKLLLVGDGPSRKEIEKLVRDMGLQKIVHFLGKLNDVREALYVFDIYMLTSIAVETFSNSTLEAMSMSRPVVISNISGASEMVDDMECGYIFEPGNTDDLIRVLKTAIYDESRLKIANAGREKVCREFSVGRMVREYERVMGL